MENGNLNNIDTLSANTITLPTNSIPDSYLSSNVALKDSNNAFTNINSFSGTINLNMGNVMNLNGNSYLNFISGTGGVSNTYVGQGIAGLFSIAGQTNSSRLQFSIKNSSGTILIPFFADSNSMYISSGSSTITLTNTNMTLSSSTTPTITTQAPSASNDLSIANTAWIIAKNYLTSASLSTYALLAGPQTFTGIHNFPTPATTTNTTQVATTAYVKSNLSSYAVLAPTTQTFTGSNNFPTQLTTDNSTLVATTAYVKGQNYITSTSLTPYALLNPSGTQTFGTGNNTFTNTTTFTNGLNSNSNITLFSGSFSSNIKQNTLGLEITNVDTSKYIQLITRTSGGANVIGVSCANGNSAYLQGDSSLNQISITGTQANIGGTSVPTITTQPLSTSNTNEIATTQWSKTQLTGYASLNLANTINGKNNFTQRLDCKDVAPNYALVIQNTVSTSSGGLLVSGAGSYNGINNAGDFAVIASGATIDTGTLNLTTWANSFCGIKITNNTITQNAPFTCGYLAIPSPITTKSNYQIGYTWAIQGSTFNSWNGFTSFGTVVTIPWDGTSFSGNTTLGVWRIDICLATNTASAMDSGMVLNTTNNFVLNTRSTWSNALTGFGVNPAQILRISSTLEITNLTTTYYLNFKLNGGSSRSDNTAGSQILFTRIA